MKKILTLLFFGCVLSGNAQLNIVSNLNTTDITNYLQGYGLNISNLYTSNNPASIGFFSGSSSMAFGSGVVLSTGLVSTISGPQTFESSMDNNQPGYPFLDTVAGATTHNATFIEFDCIPQYSNIYFDFSFGSEEYPEWVSAGYNDVFAILVSGNDTNGTYFYKKNLALIPNTNTPVSIDNVNAQTNSQYYTDNTGDTTVTFDAFTSGLQGYIKVNAGETYHFTLVVSDVGDGIIDSGVMFKTNSFRSINPNLAGLNNLAQEKELQLFPNPAQDFLRIANVNAAYNRLSIMDLNGQRLKLCPLNGAFNQVIDISELNSGTYIITLEGIGIPNQHKKLVKGN